MDNALRLTGPVIKVLGALVSSTADELSGAQIARITKLPSGTLYPILMRLERAKWVASRWETEAPQELGRPRRRFYQITGAGDKKIKAIFRELQSAIGGLAWS